MSSPAYCNGAVHITRSLRFELIHHNTLCRIRERSTRAKGTHTIASSSTNSRRGGGIELTPPAEGRVTVADRHLSSPQPV
eukprot:scaffold84046_cov43-Attheya_sp.AAC.1